MRIAVGSGNPVKRRAVKQAAETTLDAEIEAVPVDSGVSEQPHGRAETVEGAKNRAANALAAGEYDLGVGLEGGVAEVKGADGLFLIMWAAVTDGEQVGLGSGPAFRLPVEIGDRVAAGEELGPVMDDVLGEDDVAKKQGAAGALSGGIVDRDEALAAATGAAMGPFVTERY
ncbi:inosine/xanthosine triphosphatase [Halolamina salifodinae]|uniref:Probable inosine/xanthosine triphosphatase n=1 Tax=Halolamina salifodinae TaxID=1202767 RepID=A0A8T4GY89_9EURY|nr:inosine/xanthosine triphosphatase [Halolamina salifodinae]MBP1987989.1 inosine/xanthosine triphosphatase [Halolamina salifodinae]